ncbi:hypothetical protein DSM3645_02668 [Blastopirellula marina DSM 3645]|uniref:Uncharacterized protein n=1 Tax=Blastopirellula marina DSM 3645 TaxID=314230 RepID=A3ZVJ7_9BACT|nr:hypothetical protein DSM3645_02668 [Blastopirellula marina DSM 3645]
MRSFSTNWLPKKFRNSATRRKCGNGRWKPVIRKVRR